MEVGLRPVMQAVRVPAFVEGWLERSEAWAGQSLPPRRDRHSSADERSSPQRVILRSDRSLFEWLAESWGHERQSWLSEPVKAPPTASVGPQR